MTRLTAAIFFLMGAMSFSAHADSAEHDGTFKVPMREAFQFYDEFISIEDDQRDHLELVYSISTGHPVGRSIEAWYEYAGVRVNLLVQPSGDIPWLPAPDVVAANPLIKTALPASQTRFETRLSPNLPSWEEVDVWAVRRAIAQANAAMRQVVGSSARTMRVNAVAFEMAAGGTVDVLMSDGAVQTLLPSADGRVVFQPSRMRRAVRLLFSQRPSSDAFIQ